jgi:hypothetical protein
MDLNYRTRDKAFGNAEHGCRKPEVGKSRGTSWKK